MGAIAQAVTESRGADMRGRHTTSTSTLLQLADGGTLIDTPGLRDVQLWDDGTTVNASFEDVASLATACRFRDCSHHTEPGCAIQGALVEGSLAA